MGGRSRGGATRIGQNAHPHIWRIRRQRGRRKGRFGRVGTKGGFGVDMAMFKNCTGTVFTLKPAVFGRFDASQGLEWARQGSSELGGACGEHHSEGQRGQRAVAGLRQGPRLGTGRASARLETRQDPRGQGPRAVPAQGRADGRPKGRQVGQARPLLQECVTKWCLSSCPGPWQTCRPQI